ncbi:MAG: STAS domain-containing protein [Actinomycetota bacterium]
MSHAPDQPRDSESRLLAAIRNLDADPAPAAADDPLAAREAEVMDNLRNGPEEALMDIRVSHRHKAPVIHVEGELDLFTADRFRECLRAQLSNSETVVIVDLSGATYIDSTGLGILLQAARKAAGGLTIVSPRERITRLFRIAGLTSDLKLHSSLPDALAALEAE